MLKVLTSVAIAIALMTAVPAAFADGGNDLVGVSGECYTAGYASGGQAHVAVTDDGEVTHSGLVNEDDPTDLEGGAVEAVTTFAQGLPDSIGDDDTDACTGEANEDTGRKDYLEVHVLGIQVCYDGEVNVAADRDDWACGTRPIGP